MNIRLKDIFYISNLLSILRIVLMIPVIYLFEYRLFTAGIILSVFIILTDFLDGLLARKLNQVSELGKILDPLADKIALAVIVIYLAFKGATPLWFVITLITRDTAVFFAGIYLLKKKKILVQSNMPGKLCTVVLSVYFLLCIINFLVDLKPVLIIFLILSIAFLVISTAGYLLPFLKKETLTGKKQK